MTTSSGFRLFLSFFFVVFESRHPLWHSTATPRLTPPPPDQPTPIELGQKREYASNRMEYYEIRDKNKNKSRSSSSSPCISSTYRYSYP